MVYFNYDLKMRTEIYLLIKYRKHMRLSTKYSNCRYKNGPNGDDNGSSQIS